MNNRHYNAPYFDANDPEDRNNRQFTGSLSHFLTSPAIGRHDVKVGFEHFKSFRTGGNSQSSTGYVFQTDYLSSGGRPVIGPDGQPIPLWNGNATTPTAAPTRVVNWIASRGATLNIKTLSLYVLFQVYNLFNNQKLILWNTTVTPDPNSPVDELGLRTGFLRSAQFGKGTANTHYPRWSTGENGGRTFRMALGIRF